MFRFFFLLVTLTAAPLFSATWILASFELDRFRPDYKQTKNEPAALLWDDQVNLAKLKLKSGPVTPVLFLSLLPSQLPGFERELAKLRQGGGRAAALAADLLAQAGNRRMQCVGRQRGSNNFYIEFGFQEDTQDKKLEIWGNVEGELVNKGNALIFEPRRWEIKKTSAALLWDLFKDQALEDIHRRVQSAQKKKKGES